MLTNLCIFEFAGAHGCKCTCMLVGSGTSLCGGGWFIMLMCKWFGLEMGRVLTVVHPQVASAYVEM